MRNLTTIHFSNTGVMLDDAYSAQYIGWRPCLTLTIDEDQLYRFVNHSARLTYDDWFEAIVDLAEAPR